MGPGMTELLYSCAPIVIVMAHCWERMETQEVVEETRRGLWLAVVAG